MAMQSLTSRAGRSLAGPLNAPRQPVTPSRNVVVFGERRSANRTKWATASEPPASGAESTTGADAPVAPPAREMTVSEQVTYS